MKNKFIIFWGLIILFLTVIINNCNMTVEKSSPNHTTPIVKPQVPAKPIVYGEAMTNQSRPNWYWDPVVNATKYRYSLTNPINWIETIDLTFTPSNDLSSDIYTLYVQAGNQAGWSESGFFCTKINTELPNTPVINGIDSFYYNIDIVFTLSEIENDATAYYSLNNGTDWLEYLDTVTITDEGNYQIIAKQINAYGTESFITNPAVEAVIDKTAPDQPTDLSLAANDDSGKYNDDRITMITDGLTISGKAEADFNIMLYSDDILAGQTTVQSNGDWTLDINLLEGNHILTVKCVDLAGNYSVESAQLSIQIDQSLPITPYALDLAVEDDSGISNTDHITQQMTDLTINGMAEAGSTIDLFVDGILQGQTFADTSGIWSYDLILNAGINFITAKSIDLAGNISAESDPLTLTVDTDNPLPPANLTLDAIDDTGVSNSDQITLLNNGLTITGTADSEMLIELYDNSDLIGNTQADINGNWTVDISLTEGDHHLSAYCKSLSGIKSGPSAPLAIKIDFTAPIAPSNLELDSADDTGISNSDRITQETGSLTINGNGEPETVILIYDGAEVKGLGVVDISGNWMVDINLTDGNHTITAVAMDVAGNSSIVSVALPIEVITTPPNAPQLLELASIDDTGYSNTDHITQQSTGLTISGTADPDFSIIILDGLTNKGTIISQSDGSWSINLDLSEGSHNIAAIAQDIAGNVASSDILTVIVDQTSPDAPSGLDLLSSDDSGISNTDHITMIENNLTVYGTAEMNTMIDVFEGVDLLGSTAADSYGNWNLDLTLSEGIHQINAQAQDTAGNISIISDNLRITVDKTAPAIPDNLDLATDDDTGRFATDDLTMNDNGLTINATADASVTITLYEDVTVKGTTVSDATGNWTMDISLTEGIHLLQVSATDAAGNISGLSAALTITVDLTRPNPPADLILATADDTGISNTDTITNLNNGLTIGGTAEADSEIQLLEGLNSLGTAVTDINGNWSIDISLNEGQHDLNAMAIDNAGNVSSASSDLTITVDQTPPSVLTAVQTATRRIVMNATNASNYTSETVSTAYNAAGNTVTLTDYAGNTTLIDNVYVDAAGLRIAVETDAVNGDLIYLAENGDYLLTSPLLITNKAITLLGGGDVTNIQSSNSYTIRISMNSTGNILISNLKLSNTANNYFIYSSRNNGNILVESITKGGTSNQRLVYARGAVQYYKNGSFTTVSNGVDGWSVSSGYRRFNGTTNTTYWY